MRLTKVGAMMIETNDRMPSVLDLNPTAHCRLDAAAGQSRSTQRPAYRRLSFAVLACLLTNQSPAARRHQREVARGRGALLGSPTWERRVEPRVRVAERLRRGLESSSTEGRLDW